MTGMGQGGAGMHRCCNLITVLTVLAIQLLLFLQPCLAANNECLTDQTLPVTGTRISDRSGLLRTSGRTRMRHCCRCGLPEPACVLPDHWRGIQPYGFGRDHRGYGASVRRGSYPGQVRCSDATGRIRRVLYGEERPDRHQGEPHRKARLPDDCGTGDQVIPFCFISSP
jgi:hypothetical protein